MKLTEIQEIISRKMMPQIKSDEMYDAIKILRKNGVQTTIEKTPTANLQYSQEGVNSEKVNSIITDIEDGKKMPPIVISEDDFIVDGHHRHVAFTNLGADHVTVLRIHLPKHLSIIYYKKIESILNSRK